jgi:hypothetical protein
MTCNGVGRRDKNTNVIFHEVVWSVVENIVSSIVMMQIDKTPPRIGNTDLRTLPIRERMAIVHAILWRIENPFDRTAWQTCVNDYLMKPSATSKVGRNTVFLIAP